MLERLLMLLLASVILAGAIGLRDQVARSLFLRSQRSQDLCLKVNATGLTLKEFGTCR